MEIRTMISTEISQLFDRNIKVIDVIKAEYMIDLPTEKNRFDKG